MFSTPTPDAFLFDPLSLAYGHRKGEIQGREEGFLDGKSAGYKEGYAQGKKDSIAIGNGLIDEAQGFINDLHKEKQALQQQVAKQQAAIEEMQKALASSGNHIVALRNHVQKLEGKIITQKQEANEINEKHKLLQKEHERVIQLHKTSEDRHKEIHHLLEEYKNANSRLHEQVSSLKTTNEKNLNEHNGLIRQYNRNMVFMRAIRHVMEDLTRPNDALAQHVRELFAEKYADSVTRAVQKGTINMAPEIDDEFGKVLPSTKTFIMDMLKEVAAQNQHDLSSQISAELHEN